MKTTIKIIEEFTDEKKFAARVAKTMDEMNTSRVKYTVNMSPKGFLYTAMVIKRTRF